MRKNILVNRNVEMGVSEIRKNILVKLIRRNGVVGDAQEHFGRV